MLCFNCRREIPADAKICKHCEADVQPPPSREELEAAQQMLDSMPPDILEELARQIEASDSAEDFVNRIFVGDCPKCGSEDTGDCENDPEIGELLIGRCYQCGQLWCTECSKLIGDKYYCKCWDEEIEAEPF